MEAILIGRSSVAEIHSFKGGRNVKRRRGLIVSLEQWVEENCKQLGENIRHMLDIFLCIDDEEIDDVWRYTMMMIRQDWKTR